MAVTRLVTEGVHKIIRFTFISNVGLTQRVSNLLIHLCILPVRYLAENSKLSTTVSYTRQKHYTIGWLAATYPTGFGAKVMSEAPSTAPVGWMHTTMSAVLALTP
jgi:hypothetical protein